MPAATKKQKTEVRRQSKYGQPLTAREKRELAAVAELISATGPTTRLTRPTSLNCR
jgi:hypothetical protein